MEMSLEPSYSPCMYRNFHKPVAYIPHLLRLAHTHNYLSSHSRQTTIYCYHIYCNKNYVHSHQCRLCHTQHSDTVHIDYLFWYWMQSLRPQEVVVFDLPVPITSATSSITNIFSITTRHQRTISFTSFLCSVLLFFVHCPLHLF